MKKLLILLCLASTATAQNSGEITPKGIVYPRYTDANRPAAPLTIGNTIFNTSQNTHQYWNGSSWTNVSTPGSGGGPWSAVGNSIYNNTGSRVGINSPNPASDLEIQGEGGFLISAPYTVTTDPPTVTTTMPYNGTLPTITANAGRILDPGGTGNFTTNTNYASYITISPPGGNGIRFTFESLALGGSTLIFSTSSDINNTGAYLFSLGVNGANAYAIGRPFNINGGSIYIHNNISSGGTAAAGFQLLYEKLSSPTPSNYIYSENIGAGLTYNRDKASFSSGYNSRASGNYSTAMGEYNTARGSSSTAMGGSNTASGGSSTAMGRSNTASGFSSTAMGEYNSASGRSSTAMGSSNTASGNYSTAMGFYNTASGISSIAMGSSANTNNHNYSFAIGGVASSGSRATNDKASQMKMHFDEYKFLTASKDLTIIEGAITTDNTLSVFGASNTNLNGYGYLNRYTPTGLFNTAGSTPYSIYASSRVLSSEFNAFSDARHKKLVNRSQGYKDLALLNQLKVSNYTFIDTVGKGGKMQMGFIAQEVEQIVPDAINKIQDYIPSIYDMARSIAYDATKQTLTLTTNKAHDFEPKDEIKLISLEKEHKVKVESIIDANTFTVANWEKPVEKLFVFGKRVDDFRTVDYDRLFMLGISSIQELARKVEVLETENAALKKTSETLGQLKAEFAELKSLLIPKNN